MITCAIALLSALTIVGPSKNYSVYQSAGINPQYTSHFHFKPTSQFHSGLLELGVDIFRFTDHWGAAGWTNLTVISSSNPAENRVRELEVQVDVWRSIHGIADEIETQLLGIYRAKKNLPDDECNQKMLKYGEEHMYILESLRNQADILMGLDRIDETIPPWSGTPEEQAARDDLFTIIETWCPSFHRKEWKRD